MAIKIKNLDNGRTVIVHNQDDMYDLQKTDNSYNYDEPYDNDVEVDLDLDKYDEKDRDAYIQRFAFDQSKAGYNQKQTPINPTKDVYYDFDSNDEYDITDNDFDDNELDNLDDFSEDQFPLPDNETEESEQDNEFQGEIRSVTGANLVYKRQSQDGTYDELWIYTVGKDMPAEFAIRKAILSGTDIDPNTQQSDDGTQNAISKTVGNVQFINITGLPQ